MKPIKGRLFSPFQKIIYQTKHTCNRFFGFTMGEKLVWEKSDATVNRVRANDGFPIKTLRELMDEVAHVTLSNSNYVMYYRGQTIDYKNNQAKFYNDRIPQITKKRQNQ